MVTRYVITYVGQDGLRQLAEPAQGRYTYSSSNAAQARLDAITGRTAASTLRQVFGENPRFVVRPVPCYDGHFDPSQTVFDR